MDYIEAATKSRDKTQKKYRPDISSFIVKQSERIIDRFNEFFGTKDDDQMFPIDQLDNVVNFIVPGSEDFLLKAEMRPLHTSALQKAVEDISQLKLSTVAISASLSNQEVIHRLENISQKVVRVNDATKTMIRDIILDGVSKGQNLIDIRERIRDAGINEYYQGRAFTIARTETRYAYDAGGHLAYSKLGPDGNFDVVGCVGTLQGTNELGLQAAYGNYSEPYGSCGVLSVTMHLWNQVSDIHHINHQGVMVTSERL